MNTGGESRKQINNALAIVKAQGVVFIRSFLREKKQAGLPINIGNTKSNSLKNLSDALSNNLISINELDEWIGQVEGWGKQHIYFYDMPSTLFHQYQTDSENRLKTLVNDSNFHSYLNQKATFTFPDHMQLQQCLVNKDGLEVIWRQKSTDRLRTPSHDPDEREIDGDWYEFRAFRITPSRNVMRFLFQPKFHVAALFIQLPLGKDHRLALTAAEDLMTDLFGLQTVSVKDLANTIKKLDNLDLLDQDQPIDLEAHSTKFSTDGAAIEFTASKHISGFKQVESIRHVRRAMNEEAFEGESGHFNIHLNGPNNQPRTIQMSASALSNKFYFKARMSAKEMKKIIHYLAGL